LRAETRQSPARRRDKYRRGISARRAAVHRQRGIQWLHGALLTLLTEGRLSTDAGATRPFECPIRGPCQAVLIYGTPLAAASPGSAVDLHRSLWHYALPNPRYHPTHG